MGNGCKKALVFFLALLLAIPCSAQLFKRSHAQFYELPPKAILVELPTEQNRIAYFTKKGDAKRAQELEAENNKLIKKTIADFNDHFTFCPVYFFYDSSIAAIKQNNFSQVLLNGGLQASGNIVLSQKDTDYFIVYFGPNIAEGDAVNKKNDLYSSDGNSSTIPTLIALGPGFTKLHRGLPDRARMNTLKNKTPTNLELSRYTFKSKEFNLTYKPLAFYYSETLSKFYRYRKH